MGELKASEVKYSAPLVTKLGGLLFTATEIEFPASAEAITGGVELNLEKLGLTDQAVLGNAAVAGPEATSGEVATTTALPVAAWSTIVVEQKTAAESAKEIKKGLITAITINANKLFLRFFTQPVIKKPLSEANTAEKTEKIGRASCRERV